MSPRASASTAFVLLHLAGSSLGWATSFVFMKWMAGAVDPLVIATVRATGATLILLPVLALALRQDILPRRADLVPWFWIGTLNGWLPNYLTAFALTQIPAGVTAMIQASGPLLVAVGAHVMFASERLSVRRALGVVVGLVGMALLIGPAALPGGGLSPLGVAAMMGTTLSYVAGTLYIRWIAETNPYRLAFGQQSVSAVISIPLALTLLGPGAFATVPAHAWELAGLSLIATAIPVVLFMRVLARAGPTRAAMNGYLMPIWATVMAVTILGETIGWREVAAGLVILAGVALVTWTRAARPT